MTLLFDFLATRNGSSTSDRINQAAMSCVSPGRLSISFSLAGPHLLNDISAEGCEGLSVLANPIIVRLIISTARCNGQESL